MIKNATALTDWMKLSEAMLATPDDSNRFNWQFPMGVFGTLREGSCNNPRMHRSGKPYKIMRAFLPHFYARGLSISFEANSSAPFEVFCYEPDQWDKMIPSVDALEGFSPQRYTRDVLNDSRGYGYFRTLATLRLLPKEFEHELFPKTNPELSPYRNLNIPPEEFEKFQPIACWIYSSVRQNALVDPALPASPIIWPK